jgi:hypothetical protein
LNRRAGSRGGLRQILAADLSEFVAEAGEVAGGAAVFGATLGYVAASIAQDVGANVDRRTWTEEGAALGGLFGVCIVLFDAAGVS